MFGSACACCGERGSCRALAALFFVPVMVPDPCLMVPDSVCFVEGSGKLSGWEA